MVTVKTKYVEILSNKVSFQKGIMHVFFNEKPEKWMKNPKNEQRTQKYKY